jgi:CheY-like chemotaxis protein
MTPKLLLADDSATIQRVVELTFSGEDVHVVAVGDGEQAIARIPVERPDIVLADIGMPKRNGYDVAAFVKGHPDLKHIPVLLLAGAFEPVDDARATAVGCDGVLVKPFEPQHVIARVRELLDGARGARSSAAPGVASPAEPAVTGPGTPVVPVRDDSPPPPMPDWGPEEAPDAGAPAVSDRPQRPLPPPPESGESLDDYFDRLDAAFATLDAASIRRPPDSSGVPGQEEPIDLPTLDELLGDHGAPGPASVIDLPMHSPPAVPSPAPPPVEPADVSATLAPQAAEPAGASSSRNLVADAFAALLAVEQGEPGATPVRLATGTTEPVITDALVDELARRVIERLAPDTARDLVARVVSEVAERLVREEIQRIRSRQ